MSDILQSTTEIDIDKKFIITLFHKNVKGKNIDLDGKNINHCGKEGHWLEEEMGIKPNAKNEPDINGYEMKKSSKKQPLEILAQANMRFQ
jgi:hypothetical protein